MILNKLGELINRDLIVVSTLNWDWKV